LNNIGLLFAAVEDGADGVIRVEFVVFFTLA
jgi:hypothetical protein